MKHLIPALALPLASCVSAGLVPLPPAEFQGDTYTKVYFTDDYQAVCMEALEANPALRAAVATKLLAVGGCWTGEVMVLPNACSFPGGGYANVVCHEQGHSNGWEH